MEYPIPLDGLAVPALILFILFYVQEISEECPNLVRVGILLAAAIEAAVCMALGT